MIRLPYNAAAGDKIGYRQSQDSDTWHVCCNCAGWPSFGYVEQWVLPTNGKICNDCVKRWSQGRCRANILCSRDQSFILIPP
jgi:hypothetical protein